MHLIFAITDNHEIF